MISLLKKSTNVWKNHGTLALLRRGKHKLSPKRPRLLPIIRWFYIRNKQYSNADIYKTIQVDPNNITYETLSKMGHELNELGAVYDGRWDKARSDFHDRYKVSSLRNHFVHGTPWTQTEYYNRKASTVSKGQWRGCSSEEELRQFFHRIDDLYNRIENEGYKTQKQLLKESPEETKKLNNDAPSPELNEIGINIGRGGELLWQYGGQHRLCIAQILGINTVPVQVHTRHAKWERLRDTIRQTESYHTLSQKEKNHLDHPDLKDTVPKHWDK